MGSGQVAVYARISRAEEEKTGEESLENQIAVAKRWIAGENAMSDSRIRIYQDLGYSGMNMDRPAVRKLLADLYMGRIDVVVVRDFSRWSRNHLHLAEFLEYIFPERGVRFVSIGDGYDSAREESSFGNAIRGIFYEYYCRDVSQKVQSALDARKRSGSYAVARAPYGYRIDGAGSFAIVPEEAAVVRRIFAMAGNGKNSAQIGRAVGRDGAWVWRVLHNPVYRGQQVWGKSRSMFQNRGQREYLPQRAWQQQEGTHTPLVSETLYERAQAAQKHHREGMGKRRTVHLFHGLTKCGVCGKALCRKRREDGVICCKEPHGKECEISVETLWEICWRVVCRIDETGEKERTFVDNSGRMERVERICERQRRFFLHHFFERITVGGDGAGEKAENVLFLDLRCISADSQGQYR